MSKARRYFKPTETPALEVKNLKIFFLDRNRSHLRFLILSARFRIHALVKILRLDSNFKLFINSSI